MMERIPEPELMDDHDQAMAYSAADFAAPHQAFIEQLCCCFPELPPRGLALDLGCGPGDIARRFALAYPGWTLDAIDGAEAMLNCGRQQIQSEDLKRRIRFSKVFLPQDCPPHNGYDFIFSNSLLHHLANPLDLWRSLQRWSHAATPVFVMDLLRPESVEAAQSLVEQYTAGEPDLLRRDFYHSLLAAYRLEEVESQLQAVGLSRLQRSIISDRHWIAWGYLTHNSAKDLG
ncbi:class I SAM-dependent methyltransferase [Lyngbya confervoides]|uniref:Class I SAM-dependent methyltransferase n=1 Tax=Lyngbya confervoides BDU141951 TaxID=1574623 RepID=A0ABD4T2N0_9CYAN|nr:class I SAM-dependent methyltransferase [Lyngbya confervoides]MCM1982859.1 class I SAM-dependent methyltransferase [Lyngbya confervoides BDU141951]